MDILIHRDDIDRIYATNTGAGPNLDMRRIRLDMKDGAGQVTLWLTHQQANTLHAELERLWQIERPTPADATPNEVVDAYADVHAAMDPCEGCLPNSMMETSDRLAKDPQRAIGILTFGGQPL